MNNDNFMPMFSIEIEAGAKGQKGDKGDTGEQGLQGIQGIQGEQGIQGIQGIQGDPGNDGNGIASLEQTTTSHVSKGVNVWTLTDTNGETYDFNVTNGEAGVTEIEGTEELPIVLGDLEDGCYLLKGYWRYETGRSANYNLGSLCTVVTGTTSPGSEVEAKIVYLNYEYAWYNKYNDEWRYDQSYQFATQQYVYQSILSNNNNVVTPALNTKENLSNKVGTIYHGQPNTDYPNANAVEEYVAALAERLDGDIYSLSQDVGSLETSKEDKSNKVTSISSSSTDTQYPSAKLLYNQLALKEDKSNKVTSISSSSTDTQYPSAKCVYDSQTTQDETISTLETNLEETQAELDYYKTIYNVLPKVTGEGESITLSNTGESILKLDLKGQCKQDSTTGKQLFDKNNVTDGYRIGQDGRNYEDADYYVSSYISVSQNTQYTKNSPIADVYHRFAFYESQSATSFISVSSDNTITTPNNCNYLRFCGLKTEKDTTMLVQGTTIGEYEPYTGGATPRPDFPQQIHSCSGDNTIEVVGKNLLNKETCVVGKNWNGNTMAYSIATDYIKVEELEDYAFSVSNMPNYSSTTIVLFDENKNQITSTTSPVTIPSGIKYVKLSIRSATTYTWTQSDLNNANIQFEKGSTATTYTPYTKDTYEIDLRTSKNLFNKNGNVENDKTYNSSGNIEASTNDSVLLDYISVKPNTTYTISGTQYARICEYDENKMFITRQQPVSSSTTNVTTNSKTKYIRLGFVTASINAVQLEEGTSATSYEAYSSLEMRGIGTYEDYFTKNSDGQWCKYNAIGEYVANNDLTLNGDIGTSIPMLTPSLDGKPNETNSMSNLMGNSGNTKVGGITSSGKIRVSLSIDYANSISTANTFLKEKGFIIDYVLNNPYLSLIEDTTLISQLDKVEKALAKQGQTNIGQENNDAPFKIYASALKVISGE